MYMYMTCIRPPVDCSDVRQLLVSDHCIHVTIVSMVSLLKSVYPYKIKFTDS